MGLHWLRTAGVIHIHRRLKAWVFYPGAERREPSRETVEWREKEKIPAWAPCIVHRLRVGRWAAFRRCGLPQCSRSSNGTRGQRFSRDGQLAPEQLASEWRVRPVFCAYPEQERHPC